MRLTGPARVDPEARRFYDGGVLGGAGPDPDSDPRVVLVRHTDTGVERWSLERRLGYRDRELGELLVPADERFRTDLTSVPWLFTWLVPKTGAHLPAALLHDALVGGPGDPSSYTSTEGHDVARDEADRVFRDAMADTGTGVVRRWLVWTAVTLATIWAGSARWSRATTWHYRLAAGGTLLAVLALGTLATLDLFDLGVSLPWMGDRPWWAELLGGFAGAVAVPFLLALTWGRLRLAGVILGVGVALLLHVSLVLLALTGLYQGLEWTARRVPTVAWVAACGVVVVSLTAFLLSLL